jgi:hypothetical protein
MAWQDMFKSKQDVAQELALHETTNWCQMSGYPDTPEKFEELVDCSRIYLEETYDKSLIVGYLDAFFRK